MKAYLRWRCMTIVTYFMSVSSALSSGRITIVQNARLLIRYADLLPIPHGRYFVEGYNSVPGVVRERHFHKTFAAPALLSVEVWCDVLVTPSPDHEILLHLPPFPNLSFCLSGKRRENGRRILNQFINQK